MLARLFLYVALVGLISCTIFLVLALISIVRFWWRKRGVVFSQPGTWPRVTLLKPLCGMEPQLERSLESFFVQDYADFEIIFGTRDAADPALRVVNALRQRYPSVDVKVVYSGEPNHPNAKVCSLEKMIAASTSEYFVFSDSDVHVGQDYIYQVVRPLLDPEVGAVTCLYRGVPTGGIWSRLEALGMSVEMTSGVMTAELLEGMKFTLGPTMAMRREVLQQTGGIGALAEFCSDDYLLGNRIAELGYKVVLSDYVIEHIVLNRSFLDSWLHQVRWMKSTRFSRPKGHLGTALTFAMPFGILGFYAARSLHDPMLGLALLAGALANRLILSLVAGWGVVRDSNAVFYCWLYPLRDFLGFCFWSASYLGRTIVWRGEEYRLEFGGIMVRVDAEQAESAAIPADRWA
ncbi:MAG TPA: bacteriohopanetetrol glucosamine biosynthesis glycosyltransferase HpnI [Terriglobales bacterium]|nr:bacteriohopanetetrol glucosamine biosynthesis glycosyltransferase HpnI [Terriglobales bacterium]